VHLALIKYSVLRLALFVGAILVLALVGMRKSILMFVLAAAISLALSYVLLGKQRDELARALQARVEGRVARRSGIGTADADEEDAVVDAAALAARERSESGSDSKADGQQHGVDQG
jgi:Protein of unknown function (DUF4229)